MKKRLLSLLLCAIMVLPIALTGCANSSTASGDETTSSTSSSSSKAMTLTLYTITDSSTTDEALAQVEEAINVITESDFNTHIILRTATEKQYEKMISDAVEDIEEQIRIAEEEAAAKKAAEKAAREAAKQAAKEGKTTTAETTTVPEETTLEEDETVLNEFGLEETVYPEEDGTQLDIFLINSFEMFTEYQAAGYLAQLDEQLSIGSKILNQYIHPNFLSAAKVGNKTYAIPNNHVFGEYEYLLINKKVFDGLYYDIDNVASFNDLEDYFKDILKYEKGVVPLLGEYDGGVYYFAEEGSIYGSVIPADLTVPTAAPPTNLINDPTYMTYFQIMKDLKAANGISTTGKLDDGKAYGAAVIKGDYNTPAQYEEDYYVVTLKRPTATNDDIFAGAYAISKFTKDVARCMDIITYLSTNEDFINLFTYGIEDVHYTRDELTGVVTKLNKDYSMDMLYTGNQFLMWQNDSMDKAMLELSADKWDLAKAQNRDMVKHPYLGFSLKTEKVDPEDKEKKKMIDIVITDAISGTEFTIEKALKDVNSISADIFKKLEDFEPYTEIQEKKRRVRNEEGKIVQITEEVEVLIDFDTYLSNVRSEFAENPALLALTATEATETPYAQYNTWFAAANK